MAKSFNEDVKRLNLDYLLLARKMLQDDKESACVTLGITKELGNKILDLSSEALILITDTSFLLPKIGHLNMQVLNTSEQTSHESVPHRMHMAIGLATQK